MPCCFLKNQCALLLLLAIRDLRDSECEFCAEADGQSLALANRKECNCVAYLCAIATQRQEIGSKFGAFASSHDARNCEYSKRANERTRHADAGRWPVKQSTARRYHLRAACARPELLVTGKKRSRCASCRRASCRTCKCRSSDTVRC